LNYLSKLQTLVWFLKRISFWPHALELFKRKFRKNLDNDKAVADATNWAKNHVVSNSKALQLVGLLEENKSHPTLHEDQLSIAYRLFKKCPVDMGGPGDINLLYAAVILSGSSKIIETGVAYGWSSLAILMAIDKVGEGGLISVDMPYPKHNNEEFVGCVVPKELRRNWRLLRGPDRNMIKKALGLFDNQIDFCHYDSDKSWWGRAFAFPLLWEALKPGGVFISDDIQDNLFFAEFCNSLQMPFAVTEFDGKFVGIIRKS